MEDRHSGNEATDKEEGRGSAEFAPGEIEEALASFDRRTFLKVMAASVALAGGAGGCSAPQPAEKIVPRVSAPEGMLPGIPQYFSSALPTTAGPGGGTGDGWVCGFGRGVVVEQHEGRPTKIEGNPDHPGNLGGTDIFMQASVLRFYDPDRSKVCTRPLIAQPTSWGGVLNELRQFITARGGAGQVRLRLLTGTMTSPTIIGQVAALRTLFPRLQWHTYDVLSTQETREAQRQALGRTVTPVYDFTQAARIVSLDAHFLAEEPGSLRYAREFVHRRRVPFHDEAGGIGPNKTHVASPLHPAQPDANSMSRLYVAESSPTYTGAMADHHLPVKPSLMAAVARALAGAVAGSGAAEDRTLPREAAAWVAAAAADLKARPGEALVLVGPYQPAEIQALGMAINHALGAVGKTVRYHEPVDAAGAGLAGSGGGGAEGDASLSALVRALDAGEVDLLLIIDTNPVFTAPAGLQVAATLERFTTEQKGPDGQPRRLALHLGGYLDDTAGLCNLHVPLAHPLEAWGDLRGHDGTASIVQPLMEPLWQGRSAVELLGALLAIGGEAGSAGGQGAATEAAAATMAGASGPATRGADAAAANLFATGYDHVRRHWMSQWKDLSAGDREMRWRKALRDGIIEGTAAAPVQINTAPDVARLLAAAADKPAEPQRPSAALEIAFRLDPALADGSWTSNAWLQELPKPLTRVTWDTVALISPATARRLGWTRLEHESRRKTPGLRVTANGRSVEVAVWVQPGQPEETITLHAGGGRLDVSRLRSVDEAGGVDVFPLRAEDRWWEPGPEGRGADVRVESISRQFEIACVQPTQALNDRDVVRSRPVSRLATATAPGARSQVPDLYSTETPPGEKKVHLSLYDEYRYEGYKWGMVIDMSACIGCQACVIACQAENNIPVVGKDQVWRGREMHWIRIDTYYGTKTTGDELQTGEDPRVLFQPMLCQHCENAPCELVCPVEATTHSDEGINEMTYNRCVGTRYCSNNCPYKVRRFNFYQYNSHDVLTLNMQRNPNVTVRSRGVMEKCTYCIQRINRARINGKRAWAKTETDPVAPPVEMRTVEGDGWVMPKVLPRLAFQTACQQACPSEAIIFGDMNDTRALVTVLKSNGAWTPINYGVLTELNTQPRTSYLERLVNQRAAQQAAVNPAVDRAGGAA